MPGFNLTVYTRACPLSSLASVGLRAAVLSPNLSKHCQSLSASLLLVGVARSMSSVGQRLPARKVAGPAGTDARSFSSSSSVPVFCRALRMGARLTVSRTVLPSADPSPEVATAVLQQSGVFVSALVRCSPDLTDLTIPAKQSEKVQRSGEVQLAGVAVIAGLSYEVLLAAAGAAASGVSGVAGASARRYAPG